MDDPWQAALARAHAAWPELTLDVAGFVAHAEAHRGAGARDVHLPELFLAWAASTGDAAAVRTFDARVLPAIDPVVRRIDPAPAFVDEVRQAVRVRLLLGADGAAPRLAAYQGRGPLVAWVRVAATRVALNLKRARRPVVSTEDVLEELVAAEPDPELRHLKQLYRAELATALREALAALADRPRALLRLHFVDGLPLARIGRLYQVHESTASRWVRQAADAVADDARRRLHARLGLSEASVDSVVRMVRSNLELSVRRLLGEPPAT